MRIPITFPIAIVLITGYLLAQSKDLIPENMSRHHRFNDAEKWAKIFENPDRDDWQKPDEVIKAMEIKATTVIADIGSATGYFPVRFAGIASEGRIYGIDIEKELVAYLNNRAEKEGLTNLQSILGEYDDPKIPEKVDIIFICDTYHHINDRNTYFTNLKQYFNSGGKLVIVDFMKGDLPVGPPDHMKLSREKVIQEVTLAGYRLTPTTVELPYQYFLIFEME